MLTKREAEELMQELEDELNKIEKMKILMRIYRRGYNQGCRDSGVDVKD